MSTEMSYAERARQESFRYPFEPAPKSNWVTRKEAAAECRVSEDTISGYVDSGDLVAYRLAGGHLRFKRSDVEALFQLVTPKTNGTKKNGVK
jgi:excisionase family DNA binding protein